MIPTHAVVGLATGVLLVVAGIQPSSAGVCAHPNEVCADPAEETAPHDPRLERLGRGAAGLTLGVLEIPGTMLEQGREYGPGTAIFFGLPIGLGRFVARELTSLYQICSAPFIGAEKYDPPLAYTYPWHYFDAPDLPAATYLADEERELRWIRGVEVERRGGALMVRFPSDLLFPVGSAQLTDAAKPRLVGLAETLQRHPGTRLQAQGYADASGPADVNQRLSERRAIAVRDFLVAEGLQPERIDVAGYGIGSPIASNDTPEGRRLNRRVEVEVRASDVAAR